MGTMEVLLSQAGFVDVTVDVKEESRAIIAQWMPGSGAEDYVVSANISARKPVTASGAPCAISSVASCCPPTVATGHGHGHQAEQGHGHGAAPAPAACPPMCDAPCCPPTQPPARAPKENAGDCEDG